MRARRMLAGRMLPGVVVWGEIQGGLQLRGLGEGWKGQPRLRVAEPMDSLRDVANGKPQFRQLSHLDRMCRGEFKKSARAILVELGSSACFLAWGGWGIH